MELQDLVCTEVDEGSFIQLSQLNMKEFVETGRILYIWSSNCGNGKTTWSIKLMLQYFNEKWAGNGFTQRGIFINVPSFITAHKNNISKQDDKLFETISNLTNVDLVVWDDIAITQLTDYETSILLSYIDQRVLNLKCNIFTGNLSPEILKSKIGERLSSRILSGYIIELKGGDNRYGSATNFK